MNERIIDTFRWAPTTIKGWLAKMRWHSERDMGIITRTTVLYHLWPLLVIFAILLIIGVIAAIEIVVDRNWPSVIDGQVVRHRTAAASLHHRVDPQSIDLNRTQPRGI
jgi:hypothetical protein